MTRVRYAPDATAAYTELEKAEQRGDPSAARLLDAIDDALDGLEEDPGSARSRGHAFAGGLWGIAVRGRDEDWLIVWEPGPETGDAVVVRYIGPDPFA